MRLAAFLILGLSIPARAEQRPAEYERLNAAWWILLSPHLRLAAKK
jgi:hypothetical protein